MGWGLWFLAQKLSKLRLLSQNSNSPQTRGGVGVGRDASSAISRHSGHWRIASLFAVSRLASGQDGYLPLNKAEASSPTLGLHCLEAI